MALLMRELDSKSHLKKPKTPSSGLLLLIAVLPLIRRTQYMQLIFHRGHLYGVGFAIPLPSQWHPSPSHISSGFLSILGSQMRWWVWDSMLHQRVSSSYHACILLAPTLFYNTVHSRDCAAANTPSIAVLPLICNLAKCAVRSSTTSNLLLGRCGHRKWVRRETEQVLRGLETGLLTLFIYF